MLKKFSQGIKTIFTTLFFLGLGSILARSQTLGSSKENAAKPFVLGQVITLHSSILNEERTLNIYLPEGYKAEDSIRYPVVYLLDGSADEDFIHIVGLYQFNNFPWINRVPKSIVVGIANTDRKKDFTFPSSQASDLQLIPQSGHSDSFIKFIKQELQPFITSHYHCNNSKTIIGQSLGGLLVTEILFTEPGLFNQYIIISPSLWWNNGSLLDSKPLLIQKGFAQQINIYIGVGKEGLGLSVNPRVMEVDANLLAEKLKQAACGCLQVYFDYLPLENHATITHQAVFNALRLLYPSTK
jgi:hypothetical protein